MYTVSAMNTAEFQFPENIDEYLAEHSIINIATSGEDGPWASAAFYAHSGRLFFFMTTPDSQHGRDSLVSGLMAATIHEDCAYWDEVKGVQMRGRVWAVEDASEQKQGLRTFFRKYEFASQFTQGRMPEELKASLSEVRLFCFCPDVVYWIDASKQSPLRVRLFPADMI